MSLTCRMTVDLDSVASCGERLMYVDVRSLLLVRFRLILSRDSSVFFELPVYDLWLLFVILICHLYHRDT